jgi:hypothetical protein
LLRYSAAFGLDSKWSAKFRIKLVRRSVSSLKNIKISQGHSRICNVSRQVFEQTNVGAEGRLLHTIAVLDQTRIRPPNFRKQVGLLFSTIKDHGGIRRLPIIFIMEDVLKAFYSSRGWLIVALLRDDCCGIK